MCWVPFATSTNLFADIESQLGPMLEPERGPVDMLGVDHVSRAPFFGLSSIANVRPEEFLNMGQQLSASERLHQHGVWLAPHDALGRNTVAKAGDVQDCGAGTLDVELVGEVGPASARYHEVQDRQLNLSVVGPYDSLSLVRIGSFKRHVSNSR